MSGASEPVGTLEVAISHASRLLESQPRLAAEQATEILKAVPHHPTAWMLLGQALGACGQGEEAVNALKRAVQVKPDLGDAWRALGDHLMALGDAQGADEAYARHIKFSTRNPRLLNAAAALVENRIAPAEALLREHLRQYPTDVAAIRMFAEVAARLGRYGDAENLLARCLELAPSFAPARHNYAIILHRENKEPRALAEVDRLLAHEPRNPSYRSLKAAILGSLGEYEQSIELYKGLLAEYPHHPKAWMSFGHSLKTAGRREECIHAYRKSIERSPGFGEAYWSLANLKTFRFSEADLQAMRAQLARADLTEEDRFHFHFALGKALEDADEFAESFEHYLAGNTLRRAGIGYDAEETSAHVRRSKAVLTKAFFADRAGTGIDAPDPIFIVGLPRSGSTLLEQILSSHSAVEGTMELPNIISMAKDIGGKKTKSQVSKYPEALQLLTAEDLQALGQQYIEQTRIQRKTPAPFFIDKMPNNFAHTGLIHLILPNAKIIDARRHPLGCCLSGFKQHFARGQHFTYSLDEVGRYYCDYVELMAHFDEVLPGRVHRVIYETLIDDTDREVRRLLDYCGLPFEAQCLRFYENERAVRTASSEQVRRPIFREGVDQWRRYEPWLDPLKNALGSVLDRYPEAPAF